MFEEICKKFECTGCAACENVCPVGAIEMRAAQDSLQLYPVVDESKCIGCDRCRKVCPSINTVPSTKSDKVYAVLAKDKQIYRSSASGGFCTVLSQYVLSCDGVVYGASGRFDGGAFERVRVTEAQGLLELKGSKYFEYDNSGVYRNVKNDLDASKTVLYIDLPCRVAALKSYLGRDYDNLLTVDLICHGTASQTLFIIHSQKSYGLKREDIVNFRQDGKFLLSLQSGQDIKVCRPYRMDWFFYAYAKNLSQRDSCYCCKYSEINRMGDITAGDFWGLKAAVGGTYGTSAVLVNTEKGRQYFSTCTGFDATERPLTECILGNPLLSRPIVAHKRREVFKKYISNRSVRYACRRALSPLEKTRRLIAVVLQKLGVIR